MRIGTIIKNHWASKGNPVKYFIYTGTQGKYATGVYLEDNNRLLKLRVYASDFKKKDEFEPIGYSKAFEIMKGDLRKAKGESE